MFVRMALIFTTLAVLVGSGHLLTSHVEPFAIETLLPKTHSVRIAYEEFRRHYNDERYTYVLMTRPDRAFTGKEVFALNKVVHQRLIRIPNVHGVVSLNQVQDLVQDAVGYKFVDLLTADDTSVPDSALWTREFVSEDGQAFVIRVDLGHEDSSGTEFETISAIQRVVDSAGLPSPIQGHVFGTKVARFYMVKEMIRNQTIVLPTVFLLMAVVIYLLFRSVLVILLTFYIVMMAYLLTLMAVILVEGHVGPYSSYALFLVLIVGTADLVHYFSAWRDCPMPNFTKQRQAIFAKIFLPCLLTSLTTIVCFLSLSLNDAPPVRAFGYYAALGTGICFLLTFFVLPYCIRYSVGHKALPAVRWTNFIKTPEVLFRRPWWVRGIFLLVALVAVAGITRLKVEDNFYEKFVDSHKLTKATSAFHDKFGYLGTLDIILETSTTWQSEMSESVVRQFLESAAALPHVYSTRSLIDFLNEFRSITNQRGGATAGSWSADPELEGVVQLFQSLKLVDGFYREDRKELRLVLRMSDFSTPALLATMQSVEELLQELPSGYVGHIAGFAPLRSVISDSVTWDFIRSFGASCLLLAVIFFMVFRSLRLTFLAMLPNLYPLVILAGIIGFLGIGVEDNLVLIVCVVFGIAVDDSIHFLWAIRARMRTGCSVVQSVRESYATIGPALIATTGIFFVALPAFLMMEMLLFIQVGSLMVLGLTLALACDLLLLPALLSNSVEHNCTGDR